MKFKLFAMGLSIKNSIAIAYLFSAATVDAQDSFSVQSGNWYLRIGDDGSGAITPGMGFRPGIAAGLKKGSIDAELYKEKLRKLLKPGPELMNGTSPRLPLEVKIIEGDKQITGTVNDGRIWNEMMEIILPQAYPDRTSGSVWQEYIEKRQPLLPLGESAGGSKEVIQLEPDTPTGTDDTDTKHEPETSANTPEMSAPPSAPTVTQALETPEASTTTPPLNLTDVPGHTASRPPWFAGVAVLVAVGFGVLWMWLTKRK